MVIQYEKSNFISCRISLPVGFITNSLKNELVQRARKLVNFKQLSNYECHSQM